MKLLFLIEKLKSSEVFQQYKEKNPSAYFFAGFFSLDLKTNNHQYDLDYSDEKGSITAFSLSEGITMKEVESMANNIPKQIKDELKVDIDNMQEIAEKEAENKKMKLEKIIAILQNYNEKVIWNLTCMQGMKILRMKIDSSTGDILQSETLNLFDIAKRIKKK